MDWSTAVNVSADLVGVHVRVMLKVGGESMVLNDYGVEDIGEHGVGVRISGVNSAMLVIKLNSTGNGLAQGESRSLGLEASQLGPFVRSDVLGHQAVCRSDVGKRRDLKGNERISS